jgi:hypothetical protein
MAAQDIMADIIVKFLNIQDKDPAVKGGVSD